MLTDFHTDWLNLFHLDTAQRDPNHYPQFTPDMLESMRQETNLFMNEVVWSGDADWETLMFSKTTWVDQELATIYGLPDPGPGWHRVTLDDTRPGLLTRSAFLTAHAYTGSSAPVRRGYFVLSELLKSLSHRMSTWWYLKIPMVPQPFVNASRNTKPMQPVSSAMTASTPLALPLNIMMPSAHGETTGKMGPRRC